MAHLDEMQRFIRLTDSQEYPELEDITESVSAELAADQPDPLIESLSDVIFKMQSYYERSGSQDYRQGVEEGLNLAASMLTRIIESHGRNL